MHEVAASPRELAATSAARKTFLSNRNFAQVIKNYLLMYYRYNDPAIIT